MDINAVLKVGFEQYQHGAINDDCLQAYFCGAMNAFLTIGADKSELLKALSDYENIASIKSLIHKPLNPKKDNFIFEYEGQKLACVYQDNCVYDYKDNTICFYIKSTGTWYGGPNWYGCDVNVFNVYPFCFVELKNKQVIYAESANGELIQRFFNDSKATPKQKELKQ